jgi:hypothetical protein
MLFGAADELPWKGRIQQKVVHLDIPRLHIRKCPNPAMEVL